MTIQYPRRRNSLRYLGYDYAQPGADFVTTCTSGRQRLFGKVDEGQVLHSRAGEVAVERWQATPDRFPAVGIDAFVVMPDHIHAIVFCGTALHDEARRATTGKVVRWFKANVVEAYRLGVARHGWEPYERHLWQRDDHDRIIRTEAEFAAYQQYIDGNPGRWWDKHGQESDPAEG